MNDIKLPVTCSEAWHMILITLVIVSIIPVLIDPANWGVLLLTALILGIYAEVKLLLLADKNNWKFPTISCKCDDKNK